MRLTSLLPGRLVGRLSSAGRPGPWRGLALPGIACRSPLAPLVAGGGLLLGLVAVLAGTALTGFEAPLRYDAVPRVEGSVPAEPLSMARRVALFGFDSPAEPPPPLAGAPADPLAPPLEVEPALVEWRDGLQLPRIAADGRRPLDVHARAVPPGVPAAGRPLVAIVVGDLGLDGERLGQSVMLPGEIGLAHTPYAAHLAAWQRHARWHGHEVLLELPLQAADYPASDLGPWALRPTATPADQQAGLHRVLARSEGYVGLAAASESFAAAPDRFAPLAAALADRGLGFIELGGDALAAVAGEAGLAYAAALGPLDEVPEPAAIEAALGRLEAAALRDGVALGYVRSYPLTFDRLWHWSRTLEGKGITLVPASLLLRRG